ncbi:MAG: DUF4340 domain-containing protein [Lachnospiraceae bacterium]|nr:DUF4340 domain-containing protein [Lachnospiraceae bacterium]
MEAREERIKRLKRLKQKRMITVLVLLVLLIGLGGGYYAAVQYREKKAREEAQRKEEEENAAKTEEFIITEFSFNDVAAIEYTNGEGTYCFVKTESDTGNSWVREGKEDFPIKLSKLQTIILSLCKLNGTAKISEAGEPLSNYGLAEPVISGKVTLQDGTVWQFSLGDEAPYSSGYYLLEKETGDIYVVASSVRTQLSTTEMKLVQEETFPQTTQEKMTEVRVELRGEDALSYVPQTAEDGTVTYPSIFADCEKFIATTIQEYNCTDFSEYGLEEPYLTVTVYYTENVTDQDGNTTKENRTVTLELGDLTVSNNYYARVNGSPYVYIMTAAHAQKYIPQ